MSGAEKRILIVDDEPDILEFLSYNLKKEGYTTLTAANGRIALDSVDAFQPHLILLDIMMPEMDGLAVCQHLRQDSKYNDTLIAFLTARGEDYTQISSLEAGADDFITKPIRSRILHSRIKALLRRHNGLRSDSSEEIEIGELYMSPEMFAVKYRGEAVNLVRKEFNLLYLLASRPGRVFKRDEILSRIWGDDIIVGTRTIDVHVRKIREKTSSEIIFTVKGVGYKFDG